VSDVRRAAVVTGGASGIGLEIVRLLGDEGMGVVAVDRSAEACAGARESLASWGDRIRIVAADIGTPEGAAAGIAAAIESFGRIDLLCNNAAVHPSETVEEHGIESWREAFRVNVDGTMLCSQAALRYMKRQQGGAIVNIGSISGHAPYAGGGAYAASKAAIEMLTRVLALEAGPYGVTVNCIAPGTIRHRPGSENKSASHIPIGRAGTPADVARLVSYLASDAAGYISGTTITLDGGATAGRLRVGKNKKT
jgi:NAD(P)-dependent dehydrogenase (short-subunit alcohol dehydrogenase family)